MPQSLAKIITHIVFSTKNRVPIIPDAIRAELNAYFVGILKNLDCPSIQVNSMPDHVHVLCVLSKNHALAKVVEEIKKGTSKWIKTKSPGLRQFYWQNGYGAFSVSPSKVEEVRQYIAGQDEHHRWITFQEEFRAFLERHGIEYEQRYVWD